MSLDIAQIAKAFCSYKFAETFPHMADDIRWNNVGGDELAGREAVIERCENATKFLDTVTATITRLDVHSAGDVVIVEGAAQLVHQDGEVSKVASCDLFRFVDDRLVEITSYVIDLE